MHLQINLPEVFVRAWRPTLSDAPPQTHPLLRWHIEPLSLPDVEAAYLCVNEETLYSLVVIPDGFALPEQIQQQFINQLRWLLQTLHFPGAAPALFMKLAVLFSRTASPGIAEAVGQLTTQYALFLKMGKSIHEAQRDVNTTPFELLNLHLPLEQFLGLRHTFPPANDRMVTLPFPRAFLYAARLHLDPNPTALYCFQPGNRQGSHIEGTLPIDDLIQLNAALKHAASHAKEDAVQMQLREIEDWLTATLERLLPPN